MMCCLSIVIEPENMQQVFNDILKIHVIHGTSTYIYLHEWLTFMAKVGILQELTYPT